MAPMTPREFAERIPRPIPSDPVLRAQVEELLEKGYIIIPNCFTKAEVQEAVGEVKRLTTKDGAKPLTGRNEFEGSKTNRIFALPNKTRVFDKFYIQPNVIALNDYFLEPDYLLYVIQSITINPGEGQQIVHHDDVHVKLQRPRAPLSVAIMCPLDDFTPNNGATRVIPGSHLWGPEAKADKRKTIPALCPAGSIIYYLGTTLHSGGPNKSDKPRHAVTIQYSQSYIRPLEDLMLAVDPRKLPEIPQKIVDMMGYKSGFPFLGSGTSPLL